MLTSTPSVLELPRRACAACGNQYSLLHLHLAPGTRLCRACFAGSQHTFLARGGIEAARAGWAIARSAAYLAIFLWWANQDPAHPLRALLSGVFLADIASWFLFASLQLPFRGLAFAAELTLYVTLAVLVTRASPEPLVLDARGTAIFAAFGFMATFSLKSMRWIWTRLIDDA